ncbi:MAG: prenyltransferase/squalene oxidase repeat-containing protein [Puniceicoccaceae bacterium]
MRNTARLLLPASLFLGALLPIPLPAQSDASTEPSNLSLKLETAQAMTRALRWLEDQQEPAGNWSTPDHPAITALVVRAMLQSPAPPEVGRENPTIGPALEFILSRVQPDGGIYTPDHGLANYNTSISLMALAAAGNPDHSEIIERARAFVIRGQQFFEPGSENERFSGGVGYGNSYSHSDMSNTMFALQSLAETRTLFPGSADEDAPELDWEAAVQFLSRCQNLEETNDTGLASDDPANRGGFYYFPGKSQAGEMELPDGRVALRSYGSISYAGLLSYAYADLEPEDPRVRGVIEWLEKNFTLEENPGMGQQGRFFYFMTMATALDVAGIEQLATPGDPDLDWREALVLQLLDLQDASGFWVNTHGRWMEKDPVLVTAYTLLALNRIHDDL